MALELYYTSSPRGLRPGTSGLCTVAMTRSMSAALASRLESLCGYRPPGEDVPIERWPPALSHWTIDVGGVERHVLAAVRPVKPDHTMRSNTLAHFAVLHNSELDPAGAAWMLAQPETSATSWSGEPRLLAAERAMPRGGPAGVRACATWKSVAGDAGWAGVLANAAMLDPTRPATVIYPAGARVLDLVAEAMSLLPATYRWRVTFTTYFTQPIAGVRCTWRFCLDGTSAATAARQAGGLVIDAGAPGECTRTGEFVDAARAGREPVLVAPAVQHRPPAKAAAAPGQPAEQGPFALEPDDGAGGDTRRRVPPRRPVGVDEQDPVTAPGGRTALAVAVVAAVALLAIVAVLVVLMRNMSQESASLAEQLAQVEADRDSLRASGAEAVTLREERDSLVTQLSDVTGERDRLNSELSSSTKTIAELEARLKALTPADQSEPGTKASGPAAPGTQPAVAPPSPPESPPPSAPRDTESSPPPSQGDSGAAPSSDESAAPPSTGAGAAVMSKKDILRDQRANRTQLHGSQAPAMEETIKSPEAPSLASTSKEQTVSIRWPSLTGCVVDTVSLTSSPALESIGLAVHDGSRLVFTKAGEPFDVARVEAGESGITWTWISTGVQKVNRDLKGAGFNLPEDWKLIFGQMRLHATCGGDQRTTLLGSPRALTWTIGGSGAQQINVEVPRSFGQTSSIVWAGNQIPLSNGPSSAESDAGSIKARVQASTATTALVVLEWVPSELEQDEIDCIRQLQHAITQEQSTSRLLDLVNARLGPPSKSSQMLPSDQQAIEASFGAWKTEIRKGMDDRQQQEFNRKSLGELRLEYRAALTSQLTTMRQDLVARKGECDSASQLWRDAFTGAFVLVQPAPDSPPLARIELAVSRKLPDLPFKAAEAAAP